MKNKILPFAFLGLIIAFGTYVYNFPPKGIDPKVPLPKEDGICVDYSNEMINELDVNLIHNMVDNYKKKQLNCINTTLNTGMNSDPSFDDAHSIWFDLETLKKFVYQLEYQAKKNETSATIDKLGVRIYYAAYPHKEIMKNYKDIDWFLGDDVRKDYQQLHTLVMIPTIRTKIGDVDFNPTDKSTFVGNGLKDNKLKYGEGSTLTTAGLNGGLQRSNANLRTGAQNHGTLIPPGNPTVENFYP